MKIKSAFLVRVSSDVDKVDHPQFFDPSYPLKYIQAGLEQLGDVELHVHDCWIAGAKPERQRVGSAS